MKIVAINGSPKGKASNTNVMVSAFLEGAASAGAETVNILLAGKEIKQCQGCISCWTHTPGQCVLKDDMSEILALEEGADILVIATPLYFDHITGTLKVFIDRRIVLADPHIRKYTNGESRHINPNLDTSPFRSGAKPPKLVMISNCGYSERSHFQAVSLWVKRLALNLLTEVIGEIYQPQGVFLGVPAEELQPVTAICPQLPDNMAKYRQLLAQAGKEIVIDGRLSAAMNKELEAQHFMPDDQYIQCGNFFIDSFGVASGQ